MPGKKVVKLYFKLNRAAARPSYFVVRRGPNTDPFTPGDEVIIRRKSGGEWSGTVFDLIAANNRLAVVQVFYAGAEKVAAPPATDAITVTIEGTTSDELPPPEPEDDANG